MKPPSISAAVRVYNGEQHVAQTITAILSQTHPPEEVVVVDDGSTDGTADELEQFRGEIRVVRQANSGYVGSFNRSVSEARGDYIANCDADDIWEPDKLERQHDALLSHPQIDFAFTGARFFGLVEGPRAPYPGAGLLERADFARLLYRQNYVCTSSTLIRREFCARVGQFTDKVALCEDYDYWLRIVMAGAVCFYDPAVLVAYRTHSKQVSSDLLHMHKAEYLVHDLCSEVVDDSRLVRKVTARDLSNVARVLSDEGRANEARRVFMSSLRRWPTLRVLVWVMVLSVPGRYRRPLADGLVSLKRGLISPVSR
jgi:GT2 family glycosyltransferase